jgi:hypothetical protein
MSIVRVPFSLTSSGGLGGYVILQSAYPDGTSAYMTRAGVSGSSTKGTVWRWAKGYGSQSQQCIFFTRNFPTGYSQFQHSSVNGIGTWSYQHSSSFTTVEMNTTARPVDPTAWRLEMLAWDTTQGTAANRMRLYYNFDEVSWTHNNSGGAPIYPSSSLAIPFADSSYSNYLGTFYWGSPSNYLQDSAAMWGYCDGTQLTPSDVAEQDARGNTIPIDLITPGTFDVGSAGFLMDFADTGNYGNDVAPIVGSHTTPRDCTVTGTWTQTNDSPTDSKTDGVGNYCTMNPTTRFGQSSSTAITLSNGYLSVASGDTNNKSILGSIAIPATGKWYWEYTVDNNSASCGIGVRKIWSYQSVGVQSDSDVRNFHQDGNKSNGSGSAYGSSWTNTDVIGVAVDMDNGAIYFAINNTWQNSGDPTSGASKTGAAFTDLVSSGILWAPNWDCSGSSPAGTFEYGQNGFTYTEPTGFSALSTANLPAPTVTDPSVYMQTVLYEGNGTAIGSGGNAISSVGFQPDFVWIKNRDAADEHMLYDAVRGVTKDLNSDSTSAEATDTEGLSTFDTDGFTVGSNVAVNTNAESYVAWCMKAGGSGSSNTDGSITSTVSAAAHGGFSIVTYTGTGSNATVGHGLSSAPDLIITKNRSGTARSWRTYSAFLTSPGTQYLLLDTTNAEQTDATIWNSTSPTATVFSIGTDPGVNTLGQTNVAYCFAKTPGLIGIGSFEGNANADGSYVVVDDGGSGFAPAFVIIKNIDSGGSWCLFDNQRPGYNASTKGLLFPNATSVENNTNNVDFIANGFKCRGTSAAYNQDTLIYLAFAEYPFGGAGISQARAR